MSFIYYVLILILSYTGPVYAEISVSPNKPPIVQSEILAQNDIVVGELPSGKIRIYTDRSQTTTVELDKQDCDIMKKEDNTVGLGFKFGGLMWGFGPEIKVGHSSGVEWKGDVQRMVAEYQELCTQFNTGRLSQEEYKFEKKGIIQRGYGYAKELEKRFKDKKDNMFREMDQGKYISLQNSRFYGGCCVVDEHKEKRMLAEREIKIKEREMLFRETQIVEKEKQLLAKLESVKKKRWTQPRRVSRPQYDCRDVGVCNRSYNYNAVVPNRHYQRSSDSGYRLDILMKGEW